MLMDILKSAVDFDILALVKSEASYFTTSNEIPDKYKVIKSRHGNSIKYPE